MKISKVFRWEMGHRLPNHEGKCRNVHGHSYKLEVVIEGTPIHDGMIIDFYDISKAVKPLIEELDHAFMVQESDAELMEYLKKNDMKRVVIPVPSTVENLCIWFADRIAPTFNDYDNVSSFMVRINETENSTAELIRSCPA